ncbi:NHLM bacteriocin system ABC transporter, peptidase/ATP-binding protein [Meiothermus luteus]|uniref:NHLM bacteriocin system ABC transporter, peptidase/ATP-binding protein n=1 Tax=Meiothermus luteus TaxID=2026184 RepID=A0A399E9T3_9DEIN|nr:cysteine peptidase family C39 domain-containing protein [Meiothermus luteus]RIH81504.1 NHLM bacteriocin system ABC transporter, peptidase/ATP-binding protein [Meiothermus luteus]
MFAKLTVAVLLASLAAAQPVRDWRSLRYEGVVGQTDWFTCGPAAVATLLRRYHGMEGVDEEQVLELALRFMGKTEDQVRPSGITALALREAMGALGVPARGFRLSLEELADYFVRGGLPVVLHTTRPEPHYVVAVGLVRGNWVLADPSWGRRILPWEALLREKGFSGVTLVPLPGEAQLAGVKERQREALRWAEGRLRALEGLGRRGP